MQPFWLQERASRGGLAVGRPAAAPVQGSFAPLRQTVAPKKATAWRERPEAVGRQRRNGGARLRPEAPVLLAVDLAAPALPARGRCAVRHHLLHLLILVGSLAANDHFGSGDTPDTTDSFVLTSLKGAARLSHKRRHNGSAWLQKKQSPEEPADPDEANFEYGLRESAMSMVFAIRQ